MSATDRMAEDERRADSPLCINLQMLRASHVVLKAYDDAYRCFGVRATQMPALGVIALRGPLTIKQISEALESERSVMSRKLQTLETSGWVRQDAASGGREKRFALTDQGRELIERMLPVRLEVQRRILAKLSKDEQALLMSLCNKLQHGV